MNDKFMPAEHICGNTVNYITTILLFVAIRFISYNKSQYYSNNKKFFGENIFLATNLVNCDNEIYLWQYYPHIAIINKFGGNNTYLLKQKNDIAMGSVAIDWFASSVWRKRIFRRRGILRRRLWGRRMLWRMMLKRLCRW
jgi:hypothetical protein